LQIYNVSSARKIEQIAAGRSNLCDNYVDILKILSKVTNAQRTKIFAPKPAPLAETAVFAVGGSELLELSLDCQSGGRATVCTGTDLAGSGGF
jgi:hypothetical protein